MSKERIIILDEEANAKWALKEFLSAEGFSVVAANSIPQALEYLKEGQVGALITEYRMEQSTTLEVIREFKRALPEAYIMMLSYGEVLDEEYEKIINSGTSDFFYKPLPFRKLLLHLKKGLANRRELLRKKALEEEMKNIASQISAEVYIENRF